MRWNAIMRIKKEVYSLKLPSRENSLHSVSTCAKILKQSVLIADDFNKIQNIILLQRTAIFTFVNSNAMKFVRLNYEYSLISHVYG